MMRTLRKYPRVALSGRIELDYCGRSYQGCLENISMNGALVNIEDEINIQTGCSCTLSIFLAVEEVPQLPVQLHAETVHGSLSLVGLKFLAYCEDTSTHLVNLLNCGPCEPLSLSDGLARIKGYLLNYHSLS